MNTGFFFTACCPFCDPVTPLTEVGGGPTSGMRADAVAECPLCRREFTVVVSLSPTGRRLQRTPAPLVHPVVPALMAADRFRNQHTAGRTP